VFGLDNDPDAAATFCANIKGGTFVEKDIRKVKVDVLAPLLRGNGFKTLFSCCAPSALFEAEPDQDRWRSQTVLAARIRPLRETLETPRLRRERAGVNRLGVPTPIGELSY
jgi:hypothetical protein